MIKIIISAFTNTKSNFLINIIHGLIYKDEPIYIDMDTMIHHKLIVKTHDTNIDKLILQYGANYDLYFVGCENTRPYLKKYYSMENVNIFKTTDLIISEYNDLPKIIEHVYNSLNTFLPRELFNVDKENSMNQAMDRMLTMSVEYNKLVNKYSTELNSFYNIRGTKKENVYSILFIIYDNIPLFQYVCNILFTIYLKEFTIEQTPTYLENNGVYIIHKNDIQAWNITNQKNKITYISLQNKYTDYDNEIILHKETSDIPHILSVQIKKFNNSYKPVLPYYKFKNTILKEKLNLLLISMYESGENEMITYFEKNGYNVKSISFEKIILYYPSALHDCGIPIVYCYRNIKEAYLSTIQKGRYQNAISNICNNKKNIVSSKILLQGMIKQFQNMTLFDNIHFIKTDDLNTIRYEKLCTFLDKSLMPFPSIHWKKTNVSSNSIFSNYVNEIKMIEMYPNKIRSLNVTNSNSSTVIEENDITPKSNHSKINYLKQYNTEPIDTRKSMNFSTLKQQTHKPRNKKHNHIISNTKQLPHHKKKLYIHRKNFFLPF